MIEAPTSYQQNTTTKYLLCVCEWEKTPVHKHCIHSVTLKVDLRKKIFCICANIGVLFLQHI